MTRDEYWKLLETACEMLSYRLHPERPLPSTLTELFGEAEAKERWNELAKWCEQNLSPDWGGKYAL